MSSTGLSSPREGYVLVLSLALSPSVKAAQVLVDLNTKTCESVSVSHNPSLAREGADRTQGLAQSRHSLHGEDLDR